jgi:hypothetical protein
LINGADAKGFWFDVFWGIVRIRVKQCHEALKS